MKDSVISTIEIKGLFGYKDLEIHLNDTVKIYIGENGTGKTTILNILYYILKGDYNELNDINFSSIVINDFNNKRIEVNKESLIEFHNFENWNPREQRKKTLSAGKESSNIIGFYESYQRLSEYFDEIILNKFLDEVTFGDSLVEDFLSDIDFKPNPRSNDNRIMTLIKKDINIKMSEPSAITFLNAKTAVEEFTNKIKEYLNGTELKYFPTYRRIEEDLTKLGLTSKQSKEYD